jgi:hypothetical protein
MNIKELKLYMWSWPFLGGFLGMLISIAFQTDSAPLVIMLGLVGGYIALIAYVLGLRYLESKGHDTDPDIEADKDKDSLWK